MSTTTNGSQNIQLFALEDEIALEDDMFKLEFMHSLGEEFVDVVEVAGEFIRDVAIVEIIDDDRKYYCVWDINLVTEVVTRTNKLHILSYHLRAEHETQAATIQCQLAQFICNNACKLYFFYPFFSCLLVHIMYTRYKYIEIVQLTNFVSYYGYCPVTRCFCGSRGAILPGL